MRYRTRIYYTADQKALMWERWKEGATLHEIARLFDRAHTSVRGVLAETGGIRPAERLRGEVALSGVNYPERSCCLTKECYPLLLSPGLWSYSP